MMGTPMRASTSDAMANGLTELGLVTAGAEARGAGKLAGSGKGAGTEKEAGAGGGGRYLSGVEGGASGSLLTAGAEAVGGGLATSCLANGSAGGRDTLATSPH
jgi:hypothetical protein